MQIQKKSLFILLLTLSLFLTFNCVGQFNVDSIDAWVKQINIQYSRVNTDTSKYTLTQKDIFGKSSEGGIVESYYEGKTLQKAILSLFGEMGQSTTEYY